MGIADTATFSFLCFVTALSPKRPSPVSTLAEVCRLVVAKAEEERHTTFQINNIETLAPDKAQVWYEVGTQIGSYYHQLKKDRRTGICTSTAKKPLVDPVSVNAKREIETLEKLDQQQAEAKLRKAKAFAENTGADYGCTRA